MARLKRMYFALATGRIDHGRLLKRTIYAHNKKDFQPLHARAVEAVVFNCRLWFRKLTMYLLSEAYKLTGLRPLGFGYFTTALQRRDGGVVKYYEFTSGMPKSSLLELQKSLTERLAIAHKYLSDHLLETSVAIEEHPITGKSCVVLHQPFQNGVALIKRPYSRSMSAEQRKNYHDFLAKATFLYEDTGYLADLNSRNLFLTGQQVKLVDSILMGKIDTIMYPRTIKILRSEMRALNI